MDGRSPKRCFIILATLPLVVFLTSCFAVGEVVQARVGQSITGVQTVISPGADIVRVRTELPPVQTRDAFVSHLRENGFPIANVEGGEKPAATSGPKVTLYHPRPIRVSLWALESATGSDLYVAGEYLNAANGEWTRIRWNRNETDLIMALRQLVASLYGENQVWVIKRSDTPLHGDS